MAIVTTRAQALQLGQPRYFTGKPCRAGHVGERFTVAGDCCACRNARQNQRRKQQRAAIRKAAI